MMARYQIYSRVFSLLLMSTCISERQAEPFPCGHLSCGRLGYDFCLLPPYVADGDAECLPCEIKNNTCGTVKEQPGCQIYCQDRIRLEYDQTISELKKENARLQQAMNESEMTHQTDLHLEHDKYQTAMKQSQYYSTWVIILGGLLAVLFITMVTVSILVYKLRRSSKTAQDPEADIGPKTELSSKDSINSSAATSEVKLDIDDEITDSINRYSDDTSDFGEGRRLPSRPESSDIDSRIQDEETGRTNTTSGCAGDGEQDEQRGLLAGYDESRDPSPCRDQALRQVQPANPGGQAKMALKRNEVIMDKN